MGGRRWGRSGRAYGVVVTLSCLKRAGLSRKVRNAGQRDAQLYPPIRVGLLLRCPISSSLSRLGRGGGRASGAERRVRVCDCDKCDCDTGPLGLYY